MSGEYLNINSKQFKQKAYIHSHFDTYGYAIRLNKKLLKFLYATGLAITPFTNWMIIFANKLIKKDLVIRFNTDKFDYTFRKEAEL